MSLEAKTYEVLKCPVCKERYQNPKVLPCLHSCCHRCLKKLASFGHAFRCYMCLEEVDQNSISTLPADFWAKSVSEKLLMECFEDGEDILCTGCETRSNAVGQCQNCTDFLCQTCVDAHEITKLTKCHKIQTFKGKDRNKNEQEFPSTDRLIKCETHKSEDVRYFCISCEQAVCSECLIKKHRDHQLASVEECGNKQRTQLALAVRRSKIKLEPIERGLKEVSCLAQNVQLNAANAKLNVTNYIQQCREQLDETEQALLQEIDKKVERKSSRLKEQAKELEIIVQKFRTACNFSAKALECSNEVELMLVKSHIISRLKTLDDVQEELEPRDNDVVSFKYVKGKFEKCLADGCLGSILS